jgi:hypothetical protein
MGARARCGARPPSSASRGSRSRCARTWRERALHPTNTPNATAQPPHHAKPPYAIDRRGLCALGHAAMQFRLFSRACAARLAVLGPGHGSVLRPSCQAGSCAGRARAHVAHLCRCAVLLACTADVFLCMHLLRLNGHVEAVGQIRERLGADRVAVKISVHLAASPSLSRVLYFLFRHTPQPLLARQLQLCCVAAEAEVRASVAFQVRLEVGSLPLV